MSEGQQAWFMPKLNELEAEVARLRALLPERLDDLDHQVNTLCIGKSMIEILARDGAWSSEDGCAAIAADDLLHADPYAEIARLRSLSHMNAHSWDAMVVERDRLRALVSQGIEIERRLRTREAGLRAALERSLRFITMGNHPDAGAGPHGLVAQIEAALADAEGK